MRKKDSDKRISRPRASLTNAGNSCGFGLIEVVIAAGLMSIVGLGFASLMQTAASGNRNVMQTSASNDERGVISALIADQATCINNFGVARFGSASVVNTRSSESGPIFTSGFVGKTGNTVVIPVAAPLPPQNAIQIDKWSFINWKANDDPSTPAVVEGLGTLRLYISKVGSSLGAQQIVRDIPLIVNVVASTQSIASCYSTGTTDVFWQQGAAGNQIYYNGNVGIGTTSPVRAFEVSGDPSAEIILEDQQAIPNYKKWNFVADGAGVRSSLSIRQLNDALSSGPIPLKISGFGQTTVNADSTVFTGWPLTVAAPSGIGGPFKYGGTANIMANGDNHSGGGILVSDDGAFYDYNDGWITYNGSTGLRIAGSNGPGSPGTLYSTGNVGVGTSSPYGQLTIGTGSSAISFNTGSDVGTGAWIRNDGNLVVSNNSGSIFLGLNGYAGKVIHIGNNSPGAVEIAGSAPSGSITMDGSGNVNFTKIVALNGPVNVNNSMNISTALNVGGVASASAFVYTSDDRLKIKGSKLDGLSIVSALSGYHFKWKSDLRPDVGVMAQEVERVLPEAVHRTADGVRSVDYARLVAPLIEAVKTQQIEIESQRRAIESLRSAIESAR